MDKEIDGRLIRQRFMAENKHSNIPTDIINFVNREKMQNSFKLYIFLKRYGSGIVRINKECIADYLKTTGHKTKKTFWNNIKKLQEQGFIQYNKNTDWCHIIAFREICYKHNLKIKSGVIFTQIDYKNFRGFLASTSIKKAIWLVRHKRKDNEYLKRYSKSYFSDGVPVSNSFLSNYVGTSVSSARRMKVNMTNSGYGTYKKSLDPIVWSVNEYLLARKSKNLEDGCFYKIIQDRVYQVMPDKCTSFLKFRRRGNKMQKK